MSTNQTFLAPARLFPKDWERAEIVKGVHKGREGGELSLTKTVRHKQPGALGQSTKPLYGEVFLDTVAKGLVKETIELLNNDPKLIKVKGIAGDTALHIAAARGYARLIKMLLKVDKVEIDAKDKAGYTPLMLAIMGGHSEATKELCLKGADLKAKTKSGATPESLIVAHTSWPRSQLVLWLRPPKPELPPPPTPRRLPLRRRVVPPPKPPPTQPEGDGGVAGAILELGRQLGEGAAKLGKSVGAGVAKLGEGVRSLGKFLGKGGSSGKRDGAEESGGALERAEPDGSGSNQAAGPEAAAATAATPAGALVVEEKEEPDEVFWRTLEGGDTASILELLFSGLPPNRLNFKIRRCIHPDSHKCFPPFSQFKS